ncbi:hypothetical protein NX801_13495 [Streptomyces sp. LP05-1]|uniref:Integral membrane protein n=1 Tax=Streptomyces pyxinae TaxID=2970734 RepID=A0ABT2CGW1_9ACTN|nr:hypothetical protein [Streptomyces sp. LP05-1]MCS0636655.1 hypothetical protein [Streptomyces sp. LP05-1]
MTAPEPPRPGPGTPAGPPEPPGTGPAGGRADGVPAPRPPAGPAPVAPAYPTGGPARPSGAPGAPGGPASGALAYPSGAPGYPSGASESEPAPPGTVRRSAPRRLADRLVRSGRDRWAGALALLGCALLAAGSLLPQLAGADAAAVAHGYGRTATGVATLGSRLGTVGGDGLVTLLLAVLAAGPGALYLLGRARTWQRSALRGAGVLATGWALTDLLDLGTVPAPDGRLLRLAPGAGLYLVAAGAVLLLLTGVAAPRSRRQDVLAESAATHRLWRSGARREALARQQHLVVAAVKAWRDGHPQVLVEWVRLLAMYRRLGLEANAREAWRAILGGAALLVVTADDPLAEARPSLSLAGQLHRVAGTLDPVTAGELLQEVLAALTAAPGPAHPLVRELRRFLTRAGTGR